MMNIVSVFVWLFSLIGITPLDPPNTDGLVDHGSVGNLVTDAGNILHVLRQSGATSFLSYAQRCPWVLQELGGRSGYTVLAPTNRAFEEIPRVIYNAMNSSAEVTEWYLRYHILLDAIPRSEMWDNRLVPTAFKPPQSVNEPVQLMRFNTYTVWNDMLTEYEKVKTASGSPITKFDLTASNGIVHIIDRVMYPIPTGSNLARYFELEPKYSSLYSALETANLTLAISTPDFKPLTLLAPNNGAFDKLSKAQQELLKNTTILQQVLTYHVMVGSYYSAAIYEDFQHPSLEGSTIYFQKGAGGVSAEGKMVVSFDTTVTNGVVHELNGVMFPRSLNHLLSKE
ncbi:transforming growth factor-beta-induced protein ig-h3-like isoform X2 [Lytechinus variegatus]|uniref:transforming growth factor-beta-induced protein ig-h3-like isoform X2 n=1 Tax=Lytechinus variegatus TaxID=7654 RepID=UPI001BB0F9EC|nr:transforming growth factor-beta-induced protein ig-h3-like isoform X2 [Lytechinus variegatus]